MAPFSKSNIYLKFYKIEILLGTPHVGLGMARFWKDLQNYSPAGSAPVERGIAKIGINARIEVDLIWRTG